MALLSFQNVVKRYVSAGAADVYALAGLSLDIAAGRFVALVGRSGCGKSTLLNLAGAMDLPSEGTVLIDGQSTRDMNDGQLTRLRRQKIGFIFQSFQLMPTLTAAENVELPLLLARESAPRERALEKLRWVEMQGLQDRFPHQMSGGQMQRVAIARALVHQPQLLLADEPTGNLDSTTSDLILALLRRAVDELGATVVMATHSRESAALTDEIVRLRDGHIEEIWDPRQ